jgi:uncharacterized membrane protein
MPKQNFTAAQKQFIVNAIKKAELNTSGEIRVHIESKCKGDVLDRASDVFASLNMHKTKLRNGVLFYLAFDEKRFAVLGDAGINAVVPNNFWESVKETMVDQFKKGEITLGLAKGIEMAGEKLKEYFPYQANDTNELPDEISFGK